MKIAGSPSGRVLLVVLVVISGMWVFHDRSTTNNQLSMEVQQLRQQLAQLKEELSVGKNRIAQLESELQADKKQLQVIEQQSVEGVLKQTNKAVIDGWQKLLDTVNKELGKARNEVEGVLEKLESEKMEGKEGKESGSEPEKKPDTHIQSMEDKQRT